MLDVRKLRLLRELARRGTIAAVAEALAYTPSAVSQQLTALERETGVPLLERTGRRVTLTPAAQGLVEHTETILALLAEAATDLENAARALSGVLRLGAFPTAIPAVVTPAIVALSTEHPALGLTVVELDPASVPDALRTEAVDIALVQEYDHVPATPHPGLHTEPLLQETVYLATRHLTPLSALRDTPWIAGTPGTLCHTLTIRACEASGFTPHIRHHADDFTTVLALVAANQGSAFIPELALTTPPPNVTLIPLPIHRRTHLAYRQGTATRPAIKAARTALQQAAQTHSPRPS